MEINNQLIRSVYAAKEDPQKASDLIEAYLPFIRAEASKAIGRVCTEQDDEYSIAMIAFHDAVCGYEMNRGAFLSYASLLIRNSIIDHQRREGRHQGHLSIYEEAGADDDRQLGDTIADGTDHYGALADRDATAQEIAELSRVMTSFGISFTDVAENCPKQERTLEACGHAVRCAASDPLILAEMLRTKKLPMTLLVSGSGVDRKTLERHRKYLLAMLLILTNGFEYLRGHLKCVLRTKGGPAQ